MKPVAAGARGLFVDHAWQVLLWPTVTAMDYAVQAHLQRLVSLRQTQHDLAWQALEEQMR